MFTFWYLNELRRKTKTTKALDTPVKPVLDWHAQRQLWNEQNKCARRACRATMGDKKWWNTGSRLRYCTPCARLINHSSPGLCTLVQIELNTTKEK